MVPPRKRGYASPSQGIPLVTLSSPETSPSTSCSDGPLPKKNKQVSPDRLISSQLDAGSFGR